MPFCRGWISARRLARRRPVPVHDADALPATILKPICGLEKDLERNLRSCCEQDYPEYQVVLSVQRPDDLVALLSDTAPTDQALAPHWDKYASFRQYLSDNMIGPDTVLNASVVTIGMPERSSAAASCAAEVGCSLSASPK